MESEPYYVPNSLFGGIIIVKHLHCEISLVRESLCMLLLL